MKATVTSILVLIILSSFSVCALEFQLNSPSEANQNESFAVSIIANSSVSDIYDVKIWVHDDSKQYCEIFDGAEWKNPYYYLKSVFPATSEYKIKAYMPESTQICARLRKTNSSSYTEVCNNISINQANLTESSQSSSGSGSQNTTSSPSQNQTMETTQNSTPQTQNKTSSSGSSSQKDNIPPLSNTLNTIKESETPYENGKIVLSPANSSKTSEFATGKENTTLWIAYSFTGFCIVIIILLWLRKI